MKRWNMHWALAIVCLATISFQHTVVSAGTFSWPWELRSAEHCSLDGDTCEFYQCRETQRSCGKGGYYLGFAHKYCEKYIDLNSKFAAPTQDWLAKVRLCLQEELATTSELITCPEASEFGFQSHSACYLDAGVCELPIGEFYKVLRVIKGDVLRPEIFKEGMKVMYHCAVINNQLKDYVILERKLQEIEK